MAHIYLDWLTKGYSETIAHGFAAVGGEQPIPSGARVAIKPNLTFPTYQRGVMTNPEAIEALIVFLKNYTDRIVICESDSGGYNRFSMDEVFERTGITEFSRRYGVRIVNMSYVPARPIQVHAGLHNLSVPLPTFLLDETDLFISMPVPKVHSNTGLSLSLKNQWGVIQIPAERLRLHPYFKEVIYQVNKALPRTFAIVDGRYGLNRSGPLRGDAVDLNWILVGDNLFYVDGVVSYLMGVDWRKIPHLRHAFRKEGITSIENVTRNRDLSEFRRPCFYLRREWTDVPGYLTFRSRVLAYVGYESFLAKPLHWLLYRFREPFY